MIDVVGVLMICCFVWSRVVSICWSERLIILVLLFCKCILRIDVLGKKVVLRVFLRFVLMFCLRSFVLVFLR